MLLLFLLLPLSSIITFLIKDANEKRMTLLNFFLITNTIVYVFPMAYAYLSSLSDGDMWNENGSGAILWVYTVLTSGMYYNSDYPSIVKSHISFKI